jgi:hypothetical protein
MTAALYDAEQGSDNSGEPAKPSRGKGSRAPGLTGSDDPLSLEIYRAYPRQVARAAAIREIQRSLDRLQAFLNCDRPVAGARMLKAVQAYARTVKGTEAKFIPHPRTWFGQGRWEDLVDPQETKPEIKKSPKSMWAVEYERPPADSRAKPTLAEARFLNEDEALAFAEKVSGKVRRV